LTGLLGRPKTFSPIRRSSLYLALVRLVTFSSPIRVIEFARDRTAWSCTKRDHRFTGHAGSIASGAPSGRRRGRQAERACSGYSGLQRGAGMARNLSFPLLLMDRIVALAWLSMKSRSDLCMQIFFGRM
jgi:hypothetical protein